MLSMSAIWIAVAVLVAAMVVALLALNDLAVSKRPRLSIRNGILLISAVGLFGFCGLRFLEFFAASIR